MFNILEKHDGCQEPKKGLFPGILKFSEKRRITEKPELISIDQLKIQNTNGPPLQFYILQKFMYKDPYLDRLSDEKRKALTEKYDEDPAILPKVIVSPLKKSRVDSLAYKNQVNLKVISNAAFSAIKHIQENNQVESALDLQHIIEVGRNDFTLNNIERIRIRQSRMAFVLDHHEDGTLITNMLKIYKAEKNLYPTRPYNRGRRRGGGTIPYPFNKFNSFNNNSNYKFFPEGRSQ
jgi:hypothetical protein